MSRTFHHGERRIKARGIRRDPPDLRGAAKAFIALAVAQAEADAEAAAKARTKKSTLTKASSASASNDTGPIGNDSNHEDAA
jgi:hypothetical protein